MARHAITHLLRQQLKENERRIAHICKMLQAKRERARALAAQRTQQYAARVAEAQERLDALEQARPASGGAEDAQRMRTIGLRPLSPAEQELVRLKRRSGLYGALVLVPGLGRFVATRAAQQSRQIAFLRQQAQREWRAACLHQQREVRHWRRLRAQHAPLPEEQRLQREIEAAERGKARLEGLCRRLEQQLQQLQQAAPAPIPLHQPRKRQRKQRP